MATNNAGVFYVGGKLYTGSVPTFSCTPRVGNKGLYLGSFTEEPDVAPMPVISVVGSVLTASPSFSGNIQWYLDGVAIAGATNQTHTATENGNYTVSYSYIPACVSTSTATTVSTVGVPEDQINSYNIYPNPFQQDVTIELLELTGRTTVNVYDLSGRILFENVISGATQKLPLGFLSDGVYVFQFRNQDGVFTKRMVKQE
jgi:hypothetical protein